MKISNEHENRRRQAAIARYLELHPELKMDDIDCDQFQRNVFEGWYAQEKRRQEYITRPLLEDAEFIIEDDVVTIRCSSTIFAGVRAHSPCEGLLSLYQQVLKAAKAENIRISYRHRLRKRISEGLPKYEQACEEMRGLFKKIQEQAKVVEQRGLHMGTSDDEELEKLQKLCSEYTANYHSGSIVSEIAGICSSLQSHLYDIQRKDIDMIVL